MSENEKVQFVFPSGERISEEFPNGSVRNLSLGRNVQVGQRNFAVTEDPKKTADGWEIAVEEQMPSSNRT